MVWPGGPDGLGLTTLVADDFSHGARRVIVVDVTCAVVGRPQARSARRVPAPRCCSGLWVEAFGGEPVAGPSERAFAGPDVPVDPVGVVPVEGGLEAAERAAPFDGDLEHLADVVVLDCGGEVGDVLPRVTAVTGRGAYGNTGGPDGLQEPPGPSTVLNSTGRPTLATP